MIIISGFQSGVDRAAADAAEATGLKCYGYVPKGRLAEDGRIPDKYDCMELASPDYSNRTRRNVSQSHAVLIVRPNLGFKSRGTDLTQAAATNGVMPMLNFSLDVWEHQDWIGHSRGGVSSSEFVVKWLEALNIAFVEYTEVKLCVAGPRESKCPGIYARTLPLLKQIFSMVKRV